MSRDFKRFYVNATWLIKLRWVAVVGQMITIGAVILLFQIDIRMLWAVWSVIVLTAVSNLMLSLWFSRWLIGDPPQILPWDVILGMVVLMDMISLTALLFATGGPNNPFCFFFFVNISLSAVVLNRRWAWSLNALSIVGFGLLLFDHHQIDELDLGIWMLPIRQSGVISLPQLGMWIAFATCSSVIVYFMTRLTSELRLQQQDLDRVEKQRARSEKLQALGTLAAGAAHELATPLSTIAVVARDVEKAFDDHPPTFEGADDVIDDVHLIRSQLDRCRKILDRMSSHAGQGAGNPFESVAIQRLLDEVLDELPEADRVSIEINDQVAAEQISVPLDELSQALRGLIQNALDAGPSLVVLTVVQDRRGWRIEIKDSGSGMTGDILKRVSEPFFTTKQPGKGMGLGMFLAENVVGRLGGEIQIDSEPEQGTQVRVLLPQAPINWMDQFENQSDEKRNATSQPGNG